ncbi:hypothetical protein OG292_00105 [Streptomyces sp. NBC_01511]|uniref:hypothetical protein n=1 Tax=Streptomyces sp. NBC_01511 TaxID=2903889 RepID=UPI00386CD51A
MTHAPHHSHHPHPAHDLPRLARRACVTGALAAVLLTVTGQSAQADSPAPPPPAPGKAELAAARAAVTSPQTRDVLSRFFARDGAISESAAEPAAEGATVPVFMLSPGFVRGTAGAPVAEAEFLATKATSADGQVASVWTARTDGKWRVVNIATGADETTYAAKGARKAPGGTVFREPQIDAWYVYDGDGAGGRVLPLDADARKAVGSGGMTVGAYQHRVHEAYGDKLPGSAYDTKGRAGGYGPQGEPAPGADVKGPVGLAADSNEAAPSGIAQAGVAPAGPGLTGVGLAAFALTTASAGAWFVRWNRRRAAPESRLS